MDGESSHHSGEEDEEEDQRQERWGMCLPKRPDKRVKLSSRDFRKSTDACYQLIRDALYTNQWERAADLLTCYFQTLESHSNKQMHAAGGIIWRLGSEILLNHPESSPDDVFAFHENMKNIGEKNYLQITLEQAFCLLCEGKPEEAYRTLCVTESWRFGKLSLSQDSVRKLMQAYRAVLEYHTWMDLRSTMTDDDLDYSSQSDVTQEMSAFFRQASLAFQEILKYPGVWDPFVVCYVNMLETSGKKVKAEKVLIEYAYGNRNPANPNAHVYLYEFLKRNGASNERLIKVLAILHSLVPSHKLMLKFSKLLRKSESEEHQQLALTVLFDLLDFSDWKESVKAWSRLAKLMKKTLKCGQTVWIREIWTSRSDWWPSYHFRTLQVNKDWGNCAALAIKKATVAAMLQGRACSYYSMVYRLSNRKQKKILKASLCDPAVYN